MKLNNIDIGISTYKTKQGEFKIQFFFDGIYEAVVLMKGEIEGGSNILCRIQTECIHHTLYCSEFCDCDLQIENSLKIINDEGKGIFILLRQASCGLISRFDNIKEDFRNFNIVSNILKNEFRIQSIKIISINKKKINSLDNSIRISERIWYRGRKIFFGNALTKTVERISRNELYKPIRSDKKILALTIGDLNVDMQNGEKVPRGSGFNAWIAFGKKMSQENSERKYDSILLGQVGSKNDNIDDNGKLITEKIDTIISNEENYYALIGFNNNKETGLVTINRTGSGKPFFFDFDYKNANDYNLEYLRQALSIIEFKVTDYIFLSSHIFFQLEYNLDKCKAFFKTINDNIDNNNFPKIILDIAQFTVNHANVIPDGKFKINDLFDCISELRSCLFAIIGEYSSFIKLMNMKDSNCNLEGINSISKLWETKTKYLICRYGYENMSRQIIINVTENKTVKEVEFSAYDKNNQKKIGFGDFETVNALDIIN